MVTGPACEVSIGTDPVGSPASPDSPSEADTAAETPSWPTTALAGHFTSSDGAVASTWTLSVPGCETLPALSATVPLATCEPLVENICGLLRVERSMPLPGLPSTRPGSPLSVNEAVTLSLYQPPLPLKSGARAALALGAAGGVLSTTTGEDAGEYSVVSPWVASSPRTRYSQVPSDSPVPVSS